MLLFLIINRKGAKNYVKNKQKNDTDGRKRY